MSGSDRSGRRPVTRPRGYRLRGRRSTALRYGLFVLASGVAIVVLSAGSCTGDGEGLTAAGDPPSSAFGEVQAIFDANCTRCHAPGGIGYNQTGGDANDGLDLTAGSSHDALVDRPTFQMPDVDPRWRIRPGEPENSYLVQKIGSVTPKAGGRMPLDGPPYLSASEIETIRAWIAAGAAED